MRKRLLLALAVVVIVVLVVAGVQLSKLARIGVGYSAQQTCACVFVSRRTAQSCHGDLDPLARRLIAVEVGAEQVKASSFGLAHARARYQRGFGCTLEE